MRLSIDADRAETNIDSDTSLVELDKIGTITY